MNNLVVVVFPDEAKARDGVRVLQDLHREGSVTLYGAVVLQRDPTGELSVKAHAKHGPLALAVRALVGLRDDLIDLVQRDLGPGSSALIAEVSEEAPEPIDGRMSALGGTVRRERLRDYLSARVRQETAGLRAEVAEVSAEQAARKAEAMEDLLALELESAKESLQRSAERASGQLDRVEQELRAKLGVLQDQAAKAAPEVKERIQRRIAELRSDLEHRGERLRQAVELARDALR
jgi:uncharacterized membrane protein